MNPNTNRWNRSRYGFYAPFYEVVERRLEKGRRRALELLAVRPGERVLIDGCGTGLDLELLPRDAVVTAIDITPAMIEKTRRRALGLGVGLTAEVMDAAKLELVDGSFDCVILNLILAVVPDPRATAREAARVLKPGGRGVIFDKFLPENAHASFARRFINLITNLFATEINRKLGQILDGSGLTIVHEEPSIFRGLFRIVLVEKRVRVV